ncbi:MAG: TRAM domain-containing protein [Cellulomonas sp.]|nr:TRAM domain-containing protein [Cellulomonas sp.]
MTGEQLVELTIGPVAHGGHCVARLDGRVVFVRHTLPGERVRARLTHAGSDAKFWRADAVEVLEASVDRVVSPWPQAGPGGVGGGELGHVAPAAQQVWKAAVLAEQLRRLAHDDREVTVLPAPGDVERGGLAWRTRVDLVADDDGRAGMRVWHSHDVQALSSMPLATEQVAALELFERSWPAGARIEVAAPVSGDHPVVLVEGEPWDLAHDRVDRRATATRSVREQVGPHTYRVAADGFWQAHRSAPAVLVDEVLAGVGDVTGATVADLYSGAGLFTVPLAGAVGPDGAVVAVEGDERAVRDARRNVHDAPQVTLIHGDVGRVLRSSDEVVHADVVVLDPPRTGAGRTVVADVMSLVPERVVYVACDPAALARDVALFAAGGYVLDRLHGLDLFPMTHHLEAVAVLVRSGAPQV